MDHVLPPEEDPDVPAFCRAARYVREALDAGARVFKVHLQVGGFAPGDPLLDPVWGLLAEARVPVVVHAGHAPVGTGHTGPGPFGALMARYPGLTAIVAHMGAPDYGAFLRLAADYERVALDDQETMLPRPRARLARRL